VNPKILIGIPVFIPPNDNLANSRRQVHKTLEKYSEIDSTLFNVVTFGMNLSDEDFNWFSKLGLVLTIKNYPIQIVRAIIDKYALDNNYSHVIHTDDDIGNITNNTLSDLTKLIDYDYAYIMNSSKTIFNSKSNQLVIDDVLVRDSPGGDLYTPAGTDLTTAFRWEDKFAIRNGIFAVAGTYLDAILSCHKWLPDYGIHIIKREDNILLNYIARFYGFKVLPVRNIKHFDSIILPNNSSMTISLERGKVIKTEKHPTIEYKISGDYKSILNSIEMIKNGVINV
jgi:hypothetical protein